MNKANRKLLIVYYVVTIPVCLFLIFSGIFWWDSSLGSWLAIGWCILTSIGLIIAYTVKDMKMVQHIKNCTPSRYISYAEAMYPTIKENNMAAKNNYRINLFAAYYQLGQFEKAAWYLRMVDTNFQNNMAGKLAEHVYYINLSTHHLQAGDLDRAQQALEAAEKLLKSEKLTTPVKEGMLVRNQLQQYEINMRRGNIEGAQAFFENFIAVEKTLSGKISAKWHLAQIYLYNQEYSKAKETCQYILANGGETYFVGQAAGMLAELQAKEA